MGVTVFDEPNIILESDAFSNNWLFVLAYVFIAAASRDDMLLHDNAPEPSLNIQL